jgi:hypothetical protein
VVSFQAPNDRKERWAKWTAVVVCFALALDPLSFGPACWLAGENETALDVIPYASYPILWVVRAERPLPASGSGVHLIEIPRAKMARSVARAVRPY